MRYLLSIYADESFWSDATEQESAELMAAYQAFGQEAADVIEGGDALQPTATATTVRVRDGERLLTDGPFAETREQLGGYYIVDVPDLDTAIHWASKIPDAKRGSIEVRPIAVFDDAGAAAPADEAAARS